jgi:phage-related protein
MKLFRVTFLAVLAGLIVAPTADAKKDKEGGDESASSEESGGGGDEAGEMETVVIEDTGIAAFDEVFAEVRAIHETLDNAYSQLSEANASIASALGLADGTPLADALADLKGKAEGKIEVAMDGTMPTLKASDAVPENVSSAIEAVNSAVGNISKTVTDLAALPEQVKSLVDKSKAFPSQLNPTLITESGLKPTDLPKVAKKVKNNVAATDKTTDKVTMVTGELTGFVDTVKNFGASE